MCFVIVLCVFCYSFPLRNLLVASLKPSSFRKPLFNLKNILKPYLMSLFTCKHLNSLCSQECKVKIFFTAHCSVWVRFVRQLWVVSGCGKFWSSILFGKVQKVQRFTRDLQHHYYIVNLLRSSVKIFIVKTTKFISMHTNQFIDSLKCCLPFLSCLFLSSSLPPSFLLSLPLPCLPPSPLSSSSSFFLFSCSFLHVKPWIIFLLIYLGLLRFFVPIEQVSMKIIHVVFKFYSVKWELAPFYFPFKLCCKGVDRTFWVWISCLLW